MIFVDEAKIYVKAGRGGKGCESYYRDKYTRYPRPDGGNGGKGGDVIVISDHNIRTLLDYRYKQHYQALKGGNASSKGKNGRSAEDCILRVPVGTILRDHQTGLLIRDLAQEGVHVIVARGAAGGIGNAKGKKPTPPGEGEERVLDLELKLVADVGIVGFPNAGKSTLITGISKAKSKIAGYPFTTRQPILGIVERGDFHCVVADLPGIIEGAHQGKGLGDRFLRHAERTKILVHLIDMGASEERDPLEDYEKLNNELEKYSDQFLFKHRIVVANKMDLPQAQHHLKRFRKKYKEPIIPVSSLKKEGLDALLEVLQKVLCQDNSQDPSKGSSLK